MTGIKSGKAYKIRNVKSGTYLDIAENGGVGYAVGNPANDSDTQQWQLTQVEDGWNLRNVGTGEYLSTELRPKNDESILLRDTPFTWHVWDEEEVSLSRRVCVPYSKKDLEVGNHGSSDPGARVSVWGRWKGQSQMWFFEEV